MYRFAQKLTILFTPSRLITRLPGGYNFPLLTFNAFATDEKGDEESSIIIGDGYFQFQNALGMDSEGPEYAQAPRSPFPEHFGTGSNHPR